MAVQALLGSPGRSEGWLCVHFTRLWRGKPRSTNSSTGHQQACRTYERAPHPPLQHCGRYHHVAVKLTSLGFDVFAMDHQGLAVASASRLQTHCSSQTDFYPPHKQGMARARAIMHTCSPSSTMWTTSYTLCSTPARLALSSTTAPPSSWCSLV